MKLAVLIDADNISSSAAGAIFQKVSELGDPVVRRAYGMVGVFSGSSGWTAAQREFGIASRPQVSNVSGKNVADIALVIDAMDCLYNASCEGVCIISNDSDFTALAVRIREGGKAAYGFGGEKAPDSFRTACTEFFQLSLGKGSAAAKGTKQMACPRCGGRLTASTTRSRKPCRICSACGGVAMKLEALKGVFAPEGLAELERRAKLHEQAGCVCPTCGASMSLVAVDTGAGAKVEIDLCGQCGTIWYDKSEFETIVPSDGLIQATVSAGKSYRRELVLAVSSDLRAGRRKAPSLAALKSLLKSVYRVPSPDIEPIIGALRSQQMLRVDKAGHIAVLP